MTRFLRMHQTRWWESAVLGLFFFIGLVRVLLLDSTGLNSLASIQQLQLLYVLVFEPLSVSTLLLVPFLCIAGRQIRVILHPSYLTRCNNQSAAFFCLGKRLFLDALGFFLVGFCAWFLISMLKIGPAFLSDAAIIVPAFVFHMLGYVTYGLLFALLCLIGRQRIAAALLLAGLTLADLVLYYHQASFSFLYAPIYHAIWLESAISQYFTAGILTVAICLLSALILFMLSHIDLVLPRREEKHAS